MKKLNQLFKLRLITAFIISCIFFFSACSNSHRSQGAIHQKKMGELANNF